MEPFPTVSPSQNRLLVFARVPERGRVKTRLAAELGEEKTLAVHEAMIADLLRSLGAHDPSLKVEVLWTGSDAVTGSLLEKSFGHLPIAQQTGETLGLRLSMAFAERIFFHATAKVAAVGTDDPSLPRDLIDTALRLLDSCEWVLGPAHDGGYYLIGCRAAAFDPSVFEEIAWGTERVFEQTVKRIRDAGATLAVLPRRADIDRVEDLHHYARQPEMTPAVGTLLTEWGWRA